MWCVAIKQEIHIKLRPYSTWLAYGGFTLLLNSRTKFKHDAQPMFLSYVSMIVKTIEVLIKFLEAIP